MIPLMSSPPPFPAPSSPSSPTRDASGLIRLLRRRSVQLAIAGWVVTNVTLIALAGGHLPFHASSLAQPPTMAAVLSADAMFLEVFALMAAVHFITRRRAVPDIAARAPAARTDARRETLLVLAYGAAAMLGGFLVGQAFGWHAFSLHLEGMVIRTGQEVVPAEVAGWAAYNLVAYALLPLLIFRRRYTSEQLSLHSSNRRADLVLILVILALESAVQLSLNSAILHLDPRQILLGAPLTFLVGLAGTVLPAMVFVYCILTPRYLKLTGSVPATVILGGLTYAGLHFFDGWTNFASPTDAILSTLYLLLFYTGPGMFKTFITISTANAWVHAWAYHAIAPHTLIDTPMMVKVFGIR